MTVSGATLLAIGTALLGAACAAADGALLGLDDEPPPPPGSDDDARPRRERSHHALSIARVALDLATGTAAAVAMRLWEQPPAVALLLAVVIAAAVSLLVEMGPRAAGDAYGAEAVQLLRPVIRTADAATRPLTAAAAALDGVLQWLLPVQELDEMDAVEPAEEASPAGVTGVRRPVDRRAVLRRIVSLQRTEVREVMVPRVDITGLEKSTPWSEVLDRVRSAEHARLPVYDETIDEIVGVLLAKDLLEAAVTGEPPEAGWLSLVHPAAFIPESKPIDTQLRDFRATDAHIAIVVDEYGGTAGLITIEDILEEIVGDIRDEHDDEEPSVESEDGCRFWISGRATLDELAEALQHPFDRPDIATVGGLVYDVLGRVPRAGEELVIDGFRVVVERVVKRKVQRVYFERVDALVERPT